jgi:GC-rich sequence DNA-binding factor
MLLKSVQISFQKALNETDGLVSKYMILNDPRFDPETIPARRRFLARRIKLLQNIIRWRKYTGEKFGIGELSTKLLTNCILPVAESGWDVGGEEYIHKVMPFAVLSMIGFTNL